MLATRTLKFCPKNPARKEMGRKMVATAASRRLTLARCLLTSAGLAEMLVQAEADEQGPVPENLQLRALAELL
jgi:hypothetical protein